MSEATLPMELHGMDLHGIPCHVWRRGYYPTRRRYHLRVFFSAPIDQSGAESLQGRGFA